PLTGLDAAVAGFVAADPNYGPFVGRLEDLLQFLLPLYEQEGKSYLTVAIGCTGGRHRSVAVTERLGAFLKGRGFVFEDQPSAPWGFISDASYQPLRSADGHCYIDVHVQPDCYPAYRSLTADRVFAASRPFAAGEGAFAGPSPAHALVLCLT
ncbi:MAG: RNase adapter RapZ, partial [Alphaproteobacteria bacterium]